MSAPVEDVAMQVRCVHCLAEQYAPAVIAVSVYRAPCTWCSATSPPMTEAEYRGALRAARAAEGADQD